MLELLPGAARPPASACTESSKNLYSRRKFCHNCIYEFPLAQAFWKFLRPHTIRGTILGSSAVTAKALLENVAVSGGQHCVAGSQRGGASVWVEP